VTNEIREYAEQEADEVDVEEEHVHWAPWSSSGVNTSMNYESSPAPTQERWPEDPGLKETKPPPKQPASGKR
jgi:hypothetical protein